MGLRLPAHDRDLRATRAQVAAHGSRDDSEKPCCGNRISRRGWLASVSGAGMVATTSGSTALAVQGLTAGRIPGQTPDPDMPGIDIYTRPLGKSGGHGIGWSEIPQYSFRIPQAWEETPVSIADLGGTEIDLRFKNR